MVRSRRFLKLVVANQRDPRDGKHMEVLGSLQRTPVNPIPSAIGPNHESLCEIRLRFSRVKFWLGVGCGMGIPVQKALAHANLIPPPPPKYGLRTKGHYHLLSQIVDHRAKMHREEVQQFLKLQEPISYEQMENEEEEIELEETPARLVASKLYPPEMRWDMKIAEADDPFINVEVSKDKVIRKIPR
ncbi:bifunctional Ribosomal protein S16/Ribosomal protein S16 domain superfamily [Babesia duncani]|uniref:Bifunctional Ribosomal protein S16/Ribosomal protein S16 domain superfamily n=1 Tax=Babesia duncani TaxID=323732 RepID=A0AAD9PJV8_9APIC|nr:bifunctional Ribosomal protein S16/Ribosomal protein S16 domain superfamily [Babesia duncani]